MLASFFDRIGCSRLTDRILPFRYLKGWFGIDLASCLPVRALWSVLC